MTNDSQLMLEQFCSLYAFGTPIPKALREAGFEIDSISFGFSLLKKLEAQELVNEHRKFIKEKLSTSIEGIVQQLDRDRELAWRCENAGAAVQATMNKAKVLGFLDDKARVPKKITIEWDDDEEEVIETV